MKSSIGVAMITHNAYHHLPYSLPPYLRSVLKPRVIVVNSSSSDGTKELAEQMGAEVLVIPRIEFNHGATRELARKTLGTDIVLMVTPDAYPINDTIIETLVAPLISGNASVAYARQIAHDGAGFFESFPRQFNYPQEKQIRSLDDINRYGVYTFFCSNACAAYINRDLDAVGGFTPVLFGEDSIAVAKLLHKGYKVAYEPDAIVKHSHRYNVGQEFRRHFDMGLSRKVHKPLLEAGGKDSDRGKLFAKALFSRLFREARWLLPYAFLHMGAKWCGYQLGRRCHSAPRWLKQKLSSQDFYWNSIYSKK